jgi:hypothetical protein
MKSLISFAEMKLNKVQVYVAFKLCCGNHGAFEYLEVPYNAKFIQSPCVYCSKFGDDCTGFTNEHIISLYVLFKKLYQEEAIE